MSGTALTGIPSLPSRGAENSNAVSSLPFARPESPRELLPYIHTQARAQSGRRTVIERTTLRSRFYSLPSEPLSVLAHTEKDSRSATGRSAPRLH